MFLNFEPSMCWEHYEEGSCSLKSVAVYFLDPEACQKNQRLELTNTMYTTLRCSVRIDTYYYCKEIVWCPSAVWTVVNKIILI